MHRIELAVVVDTASLHQCAHDRHHLEGASVTRRPVECFTGDLGRDDVHRQSSTECLVQRRQLTGELGRPGFTAAHRDEKPHARSERRDRRRERRRVDAEFVTRGQEDVVEASALGLENDVAAVFPAAAQIGVHDAQLFVVVVAQCAEPRKLCRGRRIHGSGAPSLACTMRYTSVRVSVTRVA